MINRQQLLSDLQKLLQRLEADLLERSESTEVPEVGATLRAEYDRAKTAERTAQNYEDWRTDYITQMAAAWVLSCVFVRFLEDNQLIDPPKVAGPGKRLQRARDEHELYFRNHPQQTDRDYLLAVFDQLAKLPGTKDVFGEHNPIRELPNWLSGDAAGELLLFFQKINADTGALVHDFTDPPQQNRTGWDTRFLGDLYQDLSEAARKKYALLQTPEFVEEFILDRTLNPALDEFGLEPHAKAQSREEEEITGSSSVSTSAPLRESIFKIIDPACGSGHFLLGAFPRILDRWQRKEPGTNVRELVQRTLDSICGVDVNPYAVAIARFRLMLAAMQTCGTTKLADAPGFRLNLACGDSLLHAPLRSGGRRYTEGQLEFAKFVVDTNSSDAECEHTYQSEDLPLLKKLLREGQYHAVVANPPYITPKDRQLNERYRKRFQSCHMKYSLAVPFLEQIFKLAVPGGYTGQITANSFMKREFGKKLIESFLPKVDLTHVIDTSGAYIPGHGTPTVILFGRHRKPVASTLRTVMGIRGEPATPDEPARGLVWSAITAQIDQPGSQSEFVSVGDSLRELFHKHPWSIGGGGAAELKERLDETGSMTLSSVTDAIGILGMTNADEVMLAPNAAFMRKGVERFTTRRLALGDEVRDWSISDGDFAIFPYHDDGELIESSAILGVVRWLWHCRTVLGNRATFSRLTYFQEGRPWWEWHQVTLNRLRTPLSIVFGEVATHNHFVLDRGGKVFNRTAPVIKLPPDATEDDHLSLLGLLNSSTACFWMKQVCFPKGGDHVGQEGARVRRSLWDERYAFNGTNIEQLPLPEGRPLELSQQLDRFAQQLTENFPAAAIARWQTQPDTEQAKDRSLRQCLDDAFAVTTKIRGEMLLVQEDLDWECYRLYGLIDEDLTVRLSRARQEAEISTSPQSPGLTETAHVAATARLPLSSAMTEPHSYFCTWTCYGTWLHGDPRGSIDRDHSQFGTPPLEPDEEREREEFSLLKHAPVTLNADQRSAVHEAIVEVCEHRNWRLHAVNVRTNHVHVVVSADRNGKRVLNDFKSYATRRLSNLDRLPEQCRIEGEFRVWTRGGSARILDSEHSVQRAISYTFDEQGGNSESLNRDSRETRLREGRASGADRFLTGAAPEHLFSDGNRLGARAFEIVLARKMAAGDVQTTWFERHGSTPVTEIPQTWPEDYQQLVARRIEVIEINPEIALIEQPEYKRRWNWEPWESQKERALRDWLLNRLESYFDFDGRMNDRGEPTAQIEVSLISVAQLADIAGRDPEFHEVGAVLKGDVAFDLPRLVADLVADESVPLLPILRYKPSGLRKRAEWEQTWELQREEDRLTQSRDDAKKTGEGVDLSALEPLREISVPPKYTSADFISTGGARYWALRGKLDVPKERWISFPHCEGPDGTPVICWAGYDHLQQARAISTYYVRVQTEFGGSDDPRLIPLLACLLELLPWLKQWHNEPDADFDGMRMGDYFEGFVNEEARQLGKTIPEIKAWTPPGSTNGRSRRRSAT